MNKIIFAGKIPYSEGWRSNKCYEIIVPDKSGGKRRLITQKGAYSFDESEVAVIPPYCNYMLDNPENGDISVLIEQALLGLKEPKIIKDDENCGIRHAAVQAEKYIGNNTMPFALGNLLVSYIGANGGGTSLSPVTAQLRAELDGRVSDQTFSVENCIRQFPLNYDYIRKLFKKEVGVTPHEYLSNKRMELAHAIISGGMTNTYTNYSISQIAEICGFAEPLYFSRVFKKHYGVSPSDYVKNLKLS